MLEPCAQHRDATAGWSCDSCEAKLCPACTAEKVSAAGSALLCTRCGGRARPILVKRGELQALTAARSTPLGGLRTLVRPRPSPQDDELVPVLGETQPLIQLGDGDDGGAGPVGLDSAGNPISSAAQKPRTYEPIALDDDDGSGLEVERGYLGQPAPTAPLPPGELELDLETGEAHAGTAPPPPRHPPPAARQTTPPAPPAARQTAAPPPPPTAKEPNAALARLFGLGQHAACFDVVEQSGALLHPTTLPPHSWLGLGTKALEVGRAKAATFALRRCIDADTLGPLAPQAWLLAARTYDQLLGDRKTSDRLLQEVATRFPETKEGQFAARRLASKPA